MLASPLILLGGAVRKTSGASLSRPMAAGIAGLLLAGCAAQYNPDRAFSVQDQLRNSNARLNCPAGSIASCDVEGGGIVGRTYGNCRCIR